MVRLPAANPRSLLVLLHDAVAAGAAWLGAYLLRFNFGIPDAYWRSFEDTVVWVVVLQCLVFWLFGLYRGMWRFASLPDLKRIVLAVGMAALGVAALAAIAWRLKDIPRSVLVLDPMLLVLLMGGSRFLYRSWKEGHLLSLKAISASPVLVLGAGRAGAMLVRELLNNPQWRVVGMLDDDVAKRGRLLFGVPVLGPVQELARHAARLDVTQVIMAMPSASAAVRRRIVEQATAAGLAVLTLPAVEDLFSGRISVSEIRKVEVEDLLGRETVLLDDAGLHRLITGRVVVVTGAGGSIGSELCRQIAKFDPGLLVLFELNEFALYRMQQEFAGRFPQVAVRCVIGDVKNAARLDALFGQFRPHVVFHSAAYKHVPLMEVANAWEAVQNNVLGTLRVARAALRHRVEKLVLVSTDKAVNPVNVMGATKRLAEMVCQALQAEAGTRFVMVRFGNVLGSNGSVIPKFRAQIATGGPVTVTHPEIKRYFMSIPEAAQLVLQAGLMGAGGEIFVLDMGEPVKIVDLARDMIRLSGFGEDEIRIEFTGLRPGEKLYEELLADDEHSLPTPHPKLRIAKARSVPPEWMGELLDWLSQERVFGDHEVRRELRRLVPEYAPAARNDLKLVPGLSRGSRSEHSR
jgi:FlaA1/EpsC-like NDP-sugar epimerase